MCVLLFYLEKEKMNMFRICHKFTGRGVYSHNNYCEVNKLPYKDYWLDEMSAIHGSVNNRSRTPCTYDDEFLEVVCNAEEDFTIYGFESLDSLKRWFSLEERELLHRLGFQILSLEVENFIRYKRQMKISLKELHSSTLVEIINLSIV